MGLHESQIFPSATVLKESSLSSFNAMHSSLGVERSRILSRTEFRGIFIMIRILYDRMMTWRTCVTSWMQAESLGWLTDPYNQLPPAGSLTLVLRHFELLTFVSDETFGDYLDFIQSIEDLYGPLLSELDQLRFNVEKRDEGTDDENMNVYKEQFTVLFGEETDWADVCSLYLKGCPAQHWLVMFTESVEILEQISRRSDISDLENLRAFLVSVVPKLRSELTRFIDGEGREDRAEDERGLSGKEASMDWFCVEIGDHGLEALKTSYIDFCEPPSDSDSESESDVMLSDLIPVPLSTSDEPLGRDSFDLIPGLP